MSSSQARLKKFTHEKIAEQLDKRRNIPQYEALLLKCKYSEDSVGIVLDTSCAAWKQLQLLVRDFESKQTNGQNNTNNSQTTPANESSESSSQLHSQHHSDKQPSRSLSAHSLHYNDLNSPHDNNDSNTTSLLNNSSSNPNTGTLKTNHTILLEKTLSTHSQSSNGHSKNQPTPSNSQKHLISPSIPKKSPSKLFLFPRVPTENVRQLCQELFILKSGHTGSIFQNDFVPEKIACSTDPISPFTNLPSHLRLNPNISVHSVRKACLHNGIACIPNSLRGLVWAILLDIDVSSLSAFNIPTSIPSTNPSANLRGLDRSASSSSSIISNANNSPSPPAPPTPQKYAQLSTPEQQKSQCEQFIAKNGVLLGQTEDPSLTPINGFSVLKVDLHRTYPHLDIFSQPSTLGAMEKLLVRSCRLGKVDYKQGMNYLLATLMLVWMPVFSKYSIEDMYYPTSTAATKDTNTNNTNNNDDKKKDLTHTTSNLSTSSIQSLGNLTLPTLQPTLSASSDNNKSPSNSSNYSSIYSPQSPPNDKTSSISTTQQNAIHEKHMEYQLQMESEMHQQTKFSQCESILFANSSLITTSLCQLLNKLLPNTYSDHEFGSLQCLFMFFRLLLQYHDPVLSYYLDFNDMPPEFWASPWFLTLHVTRTKDISIILLLWDHLLLYLRQDPMLHYFISLGLLIDRREFLLQQSDTTLPETLSKLSIQSPHQLHTLFLFALQLHAQTPPSASRLLHTISTKVIGSDGDELQLLKSMMTIEIGADESLNQALSTNRYTYKDTLQSLSASYFTSLLNKDLSTAPAPPIGGIPGASLQSTNPLLQAGSLSYGSNASQPATFLFIDCRDQWSFHRGHLSTSISFPLQHLNDTNQRQQLLRTIAGFKAMHICIIHDGVQQLASQTYGNVFPIQWSPQSPQYHNFLQSQQVCTLTSLISFLVYEGVRYVSIVSNGWIQIHQTSLVLGVELVSHSEDKCPLCQNPQRYEALLKKNQSSGNDQLLGPQTTVMQNGQQTPTLGSTSLPSSVSSYFFGKGNKKNVSLEENKFNLDSRQNSQNNIFNDGNTSGLNKDYNMHSPDGAYSSQFQQQSQNGLFSSITKFFNPAQAPGGNNAQGLDYANNASKYGGFGNSAVVSKSHPTSTGSQLYSTNDSQSELFAISRDDQEDNVTPASVLYDKDSFLDDHFTTVNSLTAQQNGQSTSNGELPQIKLPQIIPLAQRQQQLLLLQQQQQREHSSPRPLPVNFSTLILTPPSLLHAIMLSNLRNISNKGHSLRQSVQFCLQSLISTALDNFRPKFITHSGYSLTGHEHNYQIRQDLPQDGKSSSNAPSASTTTQPTPTATSNLWITGRIKTSSIETTKGSTNLNTPSIARVASLVGQNSSISIESGPNATSCANVSGGNNASGQQQNNAQPSIGYLLQSQLSIIGLVRPLTFISTDATQSVLDLNADDSTCSNDNATPAHDVSNNSNSEGSPQLFFSHNIMTHCLSSVAKQFCHTFLLSVGCIEMIPSIPAKMDSKDTTPVNSIDVEWVPRPVTVPPALSSQHVLVFIPLVSIATSQMVLTSLEFLFFAKQVPPAQLQIVTFSTTHEGHDLVQHGYRKLIQRLSQQRQAQRAMQTGVDSEEEVENSDKKSNELLLIISTSLCQEEPINKQTPFVISAATQQALYNSDDEHNDVFPSIPQFFARYLTRSE